jgi:hypothetical protein
MGPAPFDDADKLRDLFTGDWSIAYSTLEMWNEGKYLRPWFTYSKTAEPRVLAHITRADVVKDNTTHPYKTSPGTLKYLFTQDAQTPTKFTSVVNPYFIGTCFGDEVRRAVSVEWRIVYFDPKAGVAATCFTPSNVCSAACHVLVRDPESRPVDSKDDSAIQAAIAAIKSQPDPFGSMGTVEPAAGSTWDTVQR